MKTCALLCALAVLVVLPTRAQLYAPPVDFHDPVQRRFPVEAARVWAWMKNKGQAGISEIAYQAETSTTGETKWTLEWKSPGKLTRKATVKYKEAALRTGAAWYRDVWKQIAGPEPLASTPGADLAAAFWEGIASGSLNRFEGLDAALKLLAANPVPTGADAARLAGTLVQGDLSQVEFSVTLDGALVGRAAAWLCAAEQEAGAKLGPEWATILFFAGRAESVAAWAGRPERTDPTWVCWDLLLRHPLPSEAFPIIIQPANRAFVAPLMTAYADMDPAYQSVFQALSQRLYPDKKFARLLDYGTALNDTRWREPYAAGFPIRSMQRWVELLANFSPLPGDPKDVTEEARALHEFEKPKATQPPSPELAALVNRGGLEATAPLNPVGVVTTTDLLMLGWDFGALQYQRLYATYSIHPDLHPEMQALLDGWFDSIAGWALLNRTRQPGSAPALATNDRFEFLRHPRLVERLSESTPSGWEQSPDIYARRRWLLDPHRALEYFTRHQGQAQAAEKLLRRVLQEGSTYLQGRLVINPDLLESIFPVDVYPGGRALREDLLRAVPANTGSRLAWAHLRISPKKDPFGYVQELERIHWSTGLGAKVNSTFLNYVRANAIPSAFRFYDQWNLTSLSYGRGRKDFAMAAYALAVLQADSGRAEELAKLAGLFAPITAALLKDDTAAVQKAIDRYFKDFPRAQATSPIRFLRDEYLPLLPALRDPHHPDHARALDSFPKEDYTLFMQWAIYGQAKLSPADAIRFFRDDTQPSMQREAVVAALEGDRAKFEQLFDATFDADFWVDASVDLTQERVVLLTWLRNRVLKVPAPAAEPELGPPGASPLYVTLSETLKAEAEAKKKKK